MPTFEMQLENLLKKDPAALLDDQRAIFKKLTAETGERYVLFGAGRLGQTTLAGLRKAGIEPLAFSDNNSNLWGAKVDGLQVYSPDAAAKEFGSGAVFIITVYTSAPARKQLIRLGLKVTSFAALAWQYPQSLTPHGGVQVPAEIFAQAGDARKAFQLWSDDISRREYVGQLLWQNSLDPAVLPPHLPQNDIYFADDLYTSLADEVFVDCGAFDGDSVEEFLKRRAGSFGQIVALEPDPENCKALQARVKSLPGETGNRIRVIQSAVGLRSEVLTFNGTGTAGSSVGDGACRVQCISLDELNDVTPSFIKMDIEGAEPDALLGARKIIKKNMPVIAVCLYHEQDHLWRIPLLIQSISSDYSLFLRRYSDECWELVCYAIPKNRLRNY